MQVEKLYVVGAVHKLDALSRSTTIIDQPNGVQCEACVMSASGSTIEKRVAYLYAGGRHRAEQLNL